MQVVTEWCTCVWLWTKAICGLAWKKVGQRQEKKSSRQARNGKSRFGNLILQNLFCKMCAGDWWVVRAVEWVERNKQTVLIVEIYNNYKKKNTRS